MTGGRACSTSAMARRPPAILLGIVLALAAVGECLHCNVCLPPEDVGDMASQRAAELWRANISRTFDGMAESDFQVCGQPRDPTKEQPEAKCPLNTDEAVCLGISHSSWKALTCGRWPADEDLRCLTTHGGAQLCPCPFSYCNSRGWRGAAASATLISALLAAALAAAW